MGRYIARRLLQMIPVFIGATLIIYFLAFALPGDPIKALGGDKPLSPEVVASLRDQYNLNDPFIVQYLKWLGGILHGDFGTTLRGQAVIDIIKQAMPVTIRLALLAFAIETVVGIGLGIRSGIKRGSFFDNSTLALTTVVVAVPTFVLGFTAQYIFGVKLGWFPIAGIQAGLQSYILPAIVLAMLSLAYVTRLTRTSIVENVGSDFRRTAVAKGLTNRDVMRRHVLPNSLIPVVTFLAVDLGTLMGGAIVTEGVFNIPGIGGALFRAIKLQDGTAVVGISVFLIFVYLFANLAVDLLYAVLDPRIRYD